LIIHRGQGFPKRAFINPSTREEAKEVRKGKGKGGNQFTRRSDQRTVTHSAREGGKLNLSGELVSLRKDGGKESSANQTRVEKKARRQMAA